MTKRKRMAGPERRQAIVEAARPLFAQNGFRGTFVGDIAKAAKVSEALLYQHFPSKKDLYNEVMDYAGKVSVAAFDKLHEPESGPEAIVLAIYLLTRAILTEVPHLQKEQQWHERLLYHSLFGDTRYARIHFKNLQMIWEEKICPSIAVATEAGDLVPNPIGNLNKIWFVHHLAMALNLCHLSDEPAFEYEGSREELIDQAVLFSLRGIGMTESAIDRYFQPGKLKEIFENVYV